MSYSHRVQLQLEATRALIKFITEHNGEVDPDLEKCLSALEQSNSKLALEHAMLVKPHGMGGLTDWFPPVTYANETKEYVFTNLKALVNHWCHMISLSKSGEMSEP